MNKKIWFIIGGGVILLLIIIVLSISFSTVGATEYALKYSKIDQSIDMSDVYENGRYCIGPFSSFITFPRTAQTIEFSNSSRANDKPLATRTNDGLALSLHISFQYQLQKSGLPTLYKNTLLNYETTFIRIAR